MKMKKSCASDRIFYLLVGLIIVVAFFITLLPFLYVISVSFSDLKAVNRGEVGIWPVGFTLDGYKQVLGQPKLWRAYYNTIWYTGVGTVCNILFTVLAAYPLSRYSFSGRKALNFFIAFTMYFGGGMIPFYLLMVQLGLYNTRMVMIIPGLISTWNVMLCRSAFTEMPNELIESAQIDGASDWRILWKIGIPLIKPTLAVVTMYYAIGHWNDFMTPLIYINREELQPLQLLLRRVLAQFSTDLMKGVNVIAALKSVASVQVRYVTIVVAIAPILAVYPFIQKYFVKGVMLGAVKG